MKNKHFFEEQIYSISNYTVPGTPLFFKPEIQVNFLEKMDKYLSPICEIHAYSLYDNEFKILIQLRERKNFESYFLANNPYWQIDAEIPETTYIFSQAMSNMQASIAKFGNKELERKGKYFNGRFKRNLITSEDEFLKDKSLMQSGTHQPKYSERWQTKLEDRCDACTSQWMSNIVNDEGLDGFINQGMKEVMSKDRYEIGERELEVERGEDRIDSIGQTYVLWASHKLGINWDRSFQLALPRYRMKLGYAFYKLLSPKRKGKF